MAKRSTIGENPLDIPVAGNSLEAVVPQAASRPARLEERLDRLEAGLADVKSETAAVKALEPGIGRAVREAAQLRTELARISEELDRLKAALPQLKDLLAPLKAEVEGLKQQVAQLQARLGPSDLPWWMRGRR
jgi:predicted  nucleic acid-binding Zn-ribbon protein